MKKALIALASVLIYGVTIFGAVAVAGPMQERQASLIKVADDAPKKEKRKPKKAPKKSEKAEKKDK